MHTTNSITPAAFARLLPEINGAVGRTWFLHCEKVTDAADILHGLIPETEHVGFGGEVSRGSIVDTVFVDEYIREDDQQVIIAELHQHSNGVGALLMSLIEGQINPKSQVVFLYDDRVDLYQTLGPQIVNHGINLELVTNNG